MYRLFVVLLLWPSWSEASTKPTTAATHPFSVHDLLAMDRISEPQAAPDGRWVVFCRSRTDLAANRRRVDLWLVSMDGRTLRQLTNHPDGSESSPRWAPDSQGVYFLSNRSGSMQVWSIRIDGGEAVQITRQPLDVGAFILSRDAGRLAVAMEVWPDCRDLECTQRRLEERTQRKTSGQLFEQLFIRHWDAWEDGRRAHWHVVDPASGKTVDVMAGMAADSPSVPWGGPEEATFSPDGRYLVFSAKDVGRSEAWSTDADLYQTPVDGTDRPKCLTDSNLAWDTQPAFSPDGRTLAYLAMAVPGYEADRYRLVLQPWPQGERRALTETWDRSPSSFAWSEDSRTLFVLADDVGQVSLFAIDAKTGTVANLWRDGVLKTPTVAAGQIVVTREHLRSPAEIYAISTHGTDMRAITQLNAASLAATRMGEPSQLAFTGAHQDQVHAYLVKPIDFDPRQKYPVAVLVHGGPQGSFNNDFHYRWNPQTYAGAGYAVLMVDFHGSTGYGQKFTDAIQGDWGGAPLTDIQLGLTAALSANPWMDGDRACALGASFGGYLVNWIAGQWPDRFRCLVSHDGNLDERAAYFDTEELWFPERDHVGTPWDNPEGYEKHNPVNLVGRWRTPMLVIHGAKDFRVVETQGFSTFNALQRRGIPSQLLYFPDENHWVLKPHNSILWHETVIAWLDRWTKGGKKERSAPPARKTR